MSYRYLHALWCDDIRQEVGNKPSFMGAYLGGMTVPTLPFMLPKLCVHAWASTPIENPFQAVTFKITRDDGAVLGELISDRSHELMPQTGPEDAKSLFLMMGFNMFGVELPENCKYIAVTMETESELLEGPKLRITVAQPIE